MVGIGRLVQSADFERILALPARWRSSHFALHHLAELPVSSSSPRPSRRAVRGTETAEEGSLNVANTKLSTGAAPTCPQPVDESLQEQWIGCVVPKRHAKRAVTRSLLKRQIRSVFQHHAVNLPAGQWLVRLRSPFSPKGFVSAASEPLRLAVRAELNALFNRSTL